MLKLGALISAKQLKECLAKFPSHLRVVDATWFLPSFGIKGFDNYKKGHLPGAVFFDIDECMTKSPYEHMLPSAEQFENYVGNMGIDNNTHVVVYNDHPKFSVFSAPRVWWTFRVFGHHAVSVLDGGLNAWKDISTDIATGVETVPAKSFKATYNSNLVKSMEDVLENIKDGKLVQLVDARPNGRFMGTEPEPREDTKPGHIPGAVSFPFMDIQGPVNYGGEEISNGSIKHPDELKKLFAAKNIDLNKPITASCGSGVTACNIALAAYLCGKEDVAVYDGSWVEWYKRSTPDQRVNCPED